MTFELIYLLQIFLHQLQWRSFYAGEWRRMSLPAMLVGETVGEILQASQFAKEIFAAVSTTKTKKITPVEDPKTPPITQKKTTQKAKNLENTDLKTRRRKEKQNKLQSIRSESETPSLQRARSRINFKVSPPPKLREFADKENCRYLANRVSPRNKPWAKKTVLFPNPLFLSATPTSHQQKFCKTRSPIITKTTSHQQKFCKTRSPTIAKNSNTNNANTRQTPHKFLIKSPVKIKNPPKLAASLSPTRPGDKLSKKSSSSPLKVSSTASKLRRSFSPSRLATRLVSPLKSRKNVQKSDGLMSGLKQRPPSSMPPRFSTGRI